MSFSPKGFYIGWSIFLFLGIIGRNLGETRAEVLLTLSLLGYLAVSIWFYAYLHSLLPYFKEDPRVFFDTPIMIYLLAPILFVWVKLRR